MTDRALGIDLGERRIGVAVSDGGGLLATPHDVIRRVGDHSIEHARILELAAEFEASIIVVGLPIGLDGSQGPAARRAAAEIRGLAKRARRVEPSVEVVEWDERLTTTIAHHALDESGVSHHRRKEMVDAVAAAVILQSWLERPVEGS